MTNLALIDLLSNIEPLICLGALVTIISRKQLSAYRYLAAFLAVRVASNALMLPILHMTGKQIEKHLAYQLYFYVYWPSYALETILGFAIIYSIFKLAMVPLKGLQTLGMLMFRWAAGISIIVALGMAFGPHTTSMTFIIRAVTQLQQTQSILTLCMLLFVTFAIRPMGLSYQSRIFGVSLGLGTAAAASLVASAWISHSPKMYTNIDLLNGLAMSLAVIMWIGYFALPEPKRRMIVLPTTSPFLRWNQISAALGDNPGFVAIGGIPPDIFAPAEVEIMRRASLKMPAELSHNQALKSNLA